MSLRKNLYRLASLDGTPHPVLDTTYDSFEAAIAAAKNWCTRQGTMKNTSLDEEGAIGVEVLTMNGSWRTLYYERDCIQEMVPF